MLLAVRPHSTGPMPASPPPPAVLPTSAETAPAIVDTRDLDREARHLFRLREGLDYDRRTADGWTDMFGADGFTFDDIIDVINPLQHLPVVSAFYRWFTGDTISPASRMAGAALFGGPVGFAVAVANLAVEEASGRDLGDQAVALLFGGEDDAGPTDIAEAPTPGLSLVPATASEAPTAAAMEQAVDRYRARIGGGGEHGERRSVDRRV